MPAIKFDNDFDPEKLTAVVEEGLGAEGDNENVNDSKELQDENSNDKSSKNGLKDGDSDELDIDIFEDDSIAVDDDDDDDPTKKDSEEDKEDENDEDDENENDDKRDLDALKTVLGDDYDIEKFRQTSNDAYSVIEKIVNDYASEKSRVETLSNELTTNKESLKNAGVLPSSYLQHEQGYILDKEYLSGAQEIANADAVINHWQTQLQAINSEEQWYGIDVNPATNQQQIAIAPSEPSPIAAAQVQQALSNAMAVKAQAQQKVSNIQAEFNTRRTSYETELKGLQSKYFSWHREADGQKKKYAIATGEEYAVSDIKNGFVQELPATFKTNVPTDLAADMFVTIQNYAHHIKTLQKELAKTKHLKKEGKIIGKKVGKTGSGKSRKSSKKSSNINSKGELDYSIFE